MQEDNTTEPESKFFFDQNIFDDHAPLEAEIEEEEPPPPVFNEGELETAKKKAFEEGRQQGIQEIKTGLDQKVVHVVQSIAADVIRLVAQEDQRDRLHEDETIKTTLSMFETLFPYIYEQHGFSELEHALNSVVKKL